MTNWPATHLSLTIRTTTRVVVVQPQSTSCSSFRRGVPPLLVARSEFALLTSTSAGSPALARCSRRGRGASLLRSIGRAWSLRLWSAAGTWRLAASQHREGLFAEDVVGGWDAGSRCFAASGGLVRQEIVGLFAEDVVGCGDAAPRCFAASGGLVR